jgi:hypothetical protein
MYVCIHSLRVSVYIRPTHICIHVCVYTHTRTHTHTHTHTHPNTHTHTHKIGTSTHKHRQTLGIKHTSPSRQEKKEKTKQKASRRSADVVRRVPRGGLGGVRHESIASDARTHARSHSLTPPMRLLPEPDCEGASICFITYETSIISSQPYRLSKLHRGLASSMEV